MGRLIKIQKKMKLICFTVKKIPVCISYNQYGSYLCDHNIMKVVVVSDPECGEVLMVSRDIVVNRPPVIVKVRNCNYGIWDLRNIPGDSWPLPKYNANKLEIL